MQKKARERGRTSLAGEDDDELASWGRTVSGRVGWFTGEKEQQGERRCRVGCAVGLAGPGSWVGLDGLIFFYFCILYFLFIFLFIISVLILLK